MKTNNTTVGSTCQSAFSYSLPVKLLLRSFDELTELMLALLRLVCDMLQSQRHVTSSARLKKKKVKKGLYYELIHTGA